MAKRVTALEIRLGPRDGHTTLTRWLLDELRRGILNGSLKPGTRLPATRDLAGQFALSRGSVVTVFEQLCQDGYLQSRVGAGTWVNDRLPGRIRSGKTPSAGAKFRPGPMAGISFSLPSRPFRMREPAVSEFPFRIWSRIAGRWARGPSALMQLGNDPRGFTPLRQAVADYLGASRAVSCDPGQIVILSGVQQALDLLSRLLLKPSDAVWTEDPGYFGATLAFRNAGAKIIPVPVGEHGLRVSEGRQMCASAKLAYVTPAHQFPLGSVMSPDTRLELLAWAREARAFVIEDDYDSEYRFERRPIPTLCSLDAGGNVILVGTFNKLLFPALGLGYVVLPPALVDPFLALRYGADLCTVGFNQAILCDFMIEGHMARHVRRMRDLYATRLACLLHEGRRRLGSALDISQIQAGLYTTGFLRNGMTSRQAELAAAARGIETLGLDRFTLNRPDPKGLVLGFGAFDEGEIRTGVARLASALRV
jgi:GntR family transcriptional regulator / MocR family aminotransferase